jgi:hypothetical protein
VKSISLQIGLVGAFTAYAWAQPAVTTAQYDNNRTNANLQETHLTPDRVASGKFGLLFTRSVDGFSYALPLYVPNLDIPGRGRRNVVYVATTTNRVYAFDADQPTESTPLWTVQVAPPTVSDPWTAPTLGILSTPVIDRATQTLYCVAMVQAGSQQQLQIYALDLLTGNLKFNSPGTLSFEFAGGTTRLDVPGALQRPSLLLSGGRLYIGVANVLEDLNNGNSQEGWLLAYNAADVTQRLAKFQVTPTGQKGGIWQAGRGLAADDQGNVYAATAGGLFDGITNFGSSYLKFSNALTLTSYFTPSNHDVLYHDNLDPSATGIIVIPESDRILGGGKTGILHLMNRLNLGGLEAPGGPPVQSWDATGGCGFVDCAQTMSLAYFPRSTGRRLYVWDRGDALRSYSFNGAVFNTTAVSVSTVTSPLAGGLTVSSRFSDNGTAIVWGLTQNVAPGLNPNFQPTQAVLRAFNPDDLTQQYWHSDVPGQAPGDFVKFTSPVVANGRVYVPTRSDRLSVYGMTCAQPAPVDLFVQYGGFRFDRATGRFLQNITFTNIGSEPVSGPFYFTVSGLPAGTELSNRTGTTNCATPAGEPYLKLHSAPLWLGAQQSFTGTLQFTAANAAQIRYTGRTLNGSGGL